MALPCSRATPFPPNATSSIFSSTTRIRSACGTLALSSDSAFDGGLEVVELDGFNEMLGEAGLQTSFDIAVIAKAADCNPRNIGDRAQLRHQIHSGSIRKGNIANKQIEFVVSGSFHSRANIVRHSDQMPATRQQFLQCSAGIVMIVDKQNFQSLSWRVSDRF